MNRADRSGRLSHSWQSVSHYTTGAFLCSYCYKLVMRFIIASKSSRQSFPKARHPTNLGRRDFLISNNSNISVLHCHWGAECESLVALIGRLSRAPRPERPSSHPPRGLQPDSTGCCAFFLAVRRLQARLCTCFRGEPSATACRSAVFAAVRRHRRGVLRSAEALRNERA